MIKYEHMNNNSYKGEVTMEKHVHIIDNEKIKDIPHIDDYVLDEMAVLFKMFSDPTRLKIMNLLLYKELNVCEIANLLNMTHSAISHQLATLKVVNLVKSRKNGKEVYYSLSDNHIHSIIAIGKEHVMEE